VPLTVWIRIPHEGSANVSIVDTKSNAVVGSMLKVWSKGYAPGYTEAGVPQDQKTFSVTIPSGLETKCAVAGDCVSGPCLLENERVLINGYRSCSGGGMGLAQSKRMNLAWTSRLRSQTLRRRSGPRDLRRDRAETVLEYWEASVLHQNSDGIKLSCKSVLIIEELGKQSIIQIRGSRYPNPSSHTVTLERRTSRSGVKARVLKCM
jgi:hypothetical protein